MKYFMVFFFAVAAYSAPESTKSTESPSINQTQVNQTSYVQDTSTIHPSDADDPTGDVEIMYSAVRRWTFDMEPIMDILLHRSRDQLYQIVDEYSNKYNHSLRYSLQRTLPHHFGRTASTLMARPSIIYAANIYGAIRFLGTDEDAIIEVLASLSNDEIKNTSTVYPEISFANMTLWDEINDDTSGDFQRLLQSILAANRSENLNVDEAAARDDAERLFHAGEPNRETDEDVFFSILTTRSYPQLQSIFNKYHNISKASIDDSIRQKFSGDTRNCLLTLVEVARSKIAYFARRLHEAMDGWGTDEYKLIFYIATRSGYDLGAIAEVYQKTYGHSLAADVEDETSGEFATLLLALINKEISP